MNGKNDLPEGRFCTPRQPPPKLYSNLDPIAFCTYWVTEDMKRIKFPTIHHHAKQDERKFCRTSTNMLALFGGPGRRYCGIPRKKSYRMSYKGQLTKKFKTELTRVKTSLTFKDMLFSRILSVSPIQETSFTTTHFSSVCHTRFSGCICPR